MQVGHGKVAVRIVTKTHLSVDEGWAELQRAGMRSAVLLQQYYEQSVKDGPLALHIIDLKQAEHDGWLDLPSPEYAGAAKCSLMIEQLRYELGSSSAEQMHALCAISDHEIELSAVQFRAELRQCSTNNRWIRQLPLCCNALCEKPLQQPRPLCCAQCKVAVYCDKACQTQVQTHMCDALCWHFISELTSRFWRLLQAWKAGHKYACVPCVITRAPAVVPAAEPGIPWQYIGHLQAPASGEYKHVSQRGVFDILKKRGTQGQSASMADMFARLSCAEGPPSVFESPDGHYLELEQVAAYVQARALEACARAVYDTYDLMTFEGDPTTVEQVIACQSAWMRTVGRLVFVSKTTYHHLHALWKQNNVDIYKLRITCEKWTHNLGLCRTIQAELRTIPAPGMMRMIGFAGDTPIVAEVPQGDAAGIAQRLDLHMLN